MMIIGGRVVRTSNFLRSAAAVRNGGLRFLADGASLSAAMTSHYRKGGRSGSTEIPSFVSPDGRLVEEEEKTAGDDRNSNGSGDAQRNRPFIFLWTRNPAANNDRKAILVRLPDVDVVYKDEKAVEKKTRRKPARNSATCHYSCSSSIEDKIMKYYLNDSDDLRNSSSVFCLFNPGGSAMRERLETAKAQRTVVFEPPKSAALEKLQTAQASADTKVVVVEPYDFSRFASGRVRDFHRGKGDSVCRALASSGARLIDDASDAAAWWGDYNSFETEPPVRMLGVAEPFKEHGLFATLLYTRITRSSIYEFGPIEVTAAVSAQQYLDFHPLAAEPKRDKRDRILVPKLVHWRAWLYRYLFKIDMIAEDSYDAFSPQISNKNRLKYDGAVITGTLYEKLGVDKNKMYWVSLRPRRCDELEALVGHDFDDEHHQSDHELTGAANDETERRQFPHLVGFVYMHKILSRMRSDTAIWDFIRNYFPGADHKTIKEAVNIDRKLSELKLDDLVKLYRHLASEGGSTFFGGPFYKEAQAFVERILCPTDLEPKVSGKKKT